MGQVVLGLKAVWGWLTGGSILAGIVTNLAISYLISAISGGQRRQRTPELIRDLALPNSLPPKRYIYGRTRVYGSPAPVRVSGQILYACVILNSRPSEEVEEIWFDKRAVSLTGDAQDFGPGGGAVPTEAPFAGFARVWIGLGDQTQPPRQILDEAPHLFVASDAWRGCTVMWLRLQAGPNEGRSERWPRVPPEVEVMLRGCKVWDPRDEAQDPDDPDTWTWSRNHALCVLDALRTNPIRQYRLLSLWLEAWRWAADVSDEPVLRADGTTELRYSADGALIFEAREIEEQVEPMMISAAARFTRVGGRLGIVPAVWRAPVQTITSVLSDTGLEYAWLKPGRELATTVRVSYVNLERDARLAELQAYEVAGARIEDGGIETVLDIELPFCTSPTQAMRVQKIIAKRQRAQRSVTTTLPPEALELVGGSVVALDLGEALRSLGGLYEVERIAPGASPLGAEAEEGGARGVALRCPATLREIAESDFAWDPLIEEQQVVDGAPFEPFRTCVCPPGELTVVTGPAHALGAQARLRFSFPASGNAAVLDYEWQWRVSGEAWEAGGLIGSDVRDADGKVFGHLLAEDGVFYDLRVRSRGVNGSLSGWRIVTDVEAIGP